MRSRLLLPCLETFLLGAVLAASVPSRAAITEIRYSYPGDCSPTKNRVTPGSDVVVLIQGEPLELMVVLAPLPVKGLASRVDFQPPPVRLETTTGFAGTVLDDSAKGVRIRLQAGPGAPSKVSAGTVRLLRSTTEIGSFKVATLVRPRIDRISLEVPSSGNISTFRIAASTNLFLRLEGQGLTDVRTESTPFHFNRFEKISANRVRIQGRAESQVTSTRVVPANFRWNLTSCPVDGPPGAALTVEVRNAQLVPVLVNLLQPQPATCSGELRTRIADAFCANLRPPTGPQDNNEATVAAPPIRWGIHGPADAITGEIDVVLKRDGVELRREAIKYLLPGEGKTFEFPRSGRTRRVRTDLNCPGCFDLQAPGSNWSDPIYEVRFGSRDGP